MGTCHCQSQVSVVRLMCDYSVDYFLCLLLPFAKRRKGRVAIATTSKLLLERNQHVVSYIKTFFMCFSVS